MAGHSEIEWTDATWNPVTGCSLVSPGCTNCYAMKLAGTRLRRHPSRVGLTTDTKAGPVWNGEVRLNEGWLDQPLAWRRPRRIFVCAHGDLFHEDVPDEWIDRVFAVMALAPHHVFQVLTKRSGRMLAYISAPRDWDAVIGAAFTALMTGDRIDMARATELRHRHGDLRWPLPNVWLGVSAEDQRRADERIPDLMATPAAVRFLSAEPLLGPIDLTNIDDAPKDGTHLVFDALTGLAHDGEETISGIFGRPDPRLDWVIAGGESGPGARPMHPDWVRSLRDQCAAAQGAGSAGGATGAGRPAFFFKQWGAWLIAEDVDRDPETGFPRYWRFQDGEEFHVVSDGHDIIMAEAEDSRTARHIWGGWWADGHGNLARKPGKKAAGALLDGRAYREMPS